MGEYFGYAGYETVLLHVRDKSTMTTGVEPGYVISLRVVFLYHVVNTGTFTGTFSLMSVTNFRHDKDPLMLV